MGCQSCKYLVEENIKEGRVGGAVYYCSKLRKYVNGAYGDCCNYEFSYGRSNFVRDEIYRNGKNYYDDTTPISFYIFMLIILSIITFILNVFNLGC